MTSREDFLKGLLNFGSGLGSAPGVAPGMLPTPSLSNAAPGGLLMDMLNKGRESGLSPEMAEKLPGSPMAQQVAAGLLAPSLGGGSAMPSADLGFPASKRLSPYQRLMMTQNQGMAPQQNVPQQNVPQQNVPQQNVPQQDAQPLDAPMTGISQSGLAMQGGQQPGLAPSPGVAPLAGPVPSMAPASQPASQPATPMAGGLFSPSTWSPETKDTLRAFGGYLGDLQQSPHVNIGDSMNRHYMQAQQQRQAGEQKQAMGGLNDYIKNNPDANIDDIANALSQAGAASNNPDLLIKAQQLRIASERQKAARSATGAPTEIMKNMIAAGIQPGSDEWKERLNQHLDGQPRGVGAQSLSSMKKAIAKEHPEWSKEKRDQAFNAYLNLEDKFPDGKPLPKLGGEARSHFNIALKAEDTAQGINASRSAQLFDRTWKKGLELMPNVVKYSGAVGYGKQRLDALKSGLGRGTPEYKDYIKFTRVTAPALANAAIKAEGANMTNEAKDMMLKSVSPTSWDTDPDSAMATYTYLGELYGSAVSPSASASISDVKQNIASGEREANAASGQQTVNVTNERTGEKRSVTLEEARSMGVPNV